MVVGAETAQAQVSAALVAPAPERNRPNGKTDILHSNSQTILNSIHEALKQVIHQRKTEMHQHASNRTRNGKRSAFEMKRGDWAMRTNGGGGRGGARRGGPALRARTAPTAHMCGPRAATSTLQTASVVIVPRGMCRMPYADAVCQ
ncbi:hypothetical protein O0L34_g13078 [Tuta absoluta]|nr:hypothetical protein O0L34_g13078 [Tuta absoluta]